MLKDIKRYAVVTGANKGIGYGVVKQLASKGIMVVLTARDEKRGLEAVQKLKDSDLSDFVIFHQLDVTDSASIAALAHFIKSQFTKLDILTNELAEECFSTNYYGCKRMVEALVPLLQLSDLPRIVNVSSGGGKLEKVSHEWGAKVLSDVENLSYERIDEVLKQYLKDLKEGQSVAKDKGWPPLYSNYVLSKACLNAYTRILAKQLPTFQINCVCPGYCATDLTSNNGIFTAEQGAEKVVNVALFPNDDDAPSGCFFEHNVKSSF